MDKYNHHTPRKKAAGLVRGFRIFCGTVFAGMLFTVSGCLDIPEEPNTAQELERLDVVVLQAGKEDSTLLKIHPSDSSIVRADIFPRQYKQQLTFVWSRHTQDTSFVLGEGQTYKIKANTDKGMLPNELEVKDEVGNSILKEFEIAVNMEPMLSTETTPSMNDTLYGNAHTSILFKWKSDDFDSFDDGKLEHTLIIDGQRYPVGHLTEIWQSGFKNGKHTFQIIVFDTFGDSDTLAPTTFYMADTTSYTADTFGDEL